MIFEGPREVEDTDEFWDIEALKLAVCAPLIYNKYTSIGSLNDGSGGLYRLGFLSEVPKYYKGAPEGQPYAGFDQSRINKYGECLIKACARLADRYYPEISARVSPRPR